MSVEMLVVEWSRLFVCLCDSDNWLWPPRLWPGIYNWSRHRYWSV